METIIILGGNKGDVRDTFKKCIERFRSLGYLQMNSSSIYSSPPWGFESENSFYNQVVVFETNNIPQEVLEDCLSIEHEFGRTRNNSGEYEDRLIDIDILFYGHEIINEENLMIPHPRLHERKFCLVPLDEILSSRVHPVLGKTIRELLWECNDVSQITRVSQITGE